MTITLTPDLETVVLKRARDRATTPESIVLEAIRNQLGPESSPPVVLPQPRDDWERRLLRVGTPCGVGVSDEALSSEGLYDQ